MEYVIPFQLQQSISIDIKFKEIQFGISSLIFQIIKEYLSNNNAAASNPLKVSLSIDKLASKLILQGNQTLVIEATELFFELDHPAIQLNIKTVSVTDTARSERILSSWFSPQQLPSSNVISVNATLGDGRHTLLELLHVSIDPIEIVFRESMRKSLKLFLKQDDMQNERKGESKSVKLKNVFISRIGMLVTYSFLRKSEWLMDSFQVKEFNGTYQDFISDVLGNATWSVFKSFIRLQGQKFSSMKALGTYAASSSMSQSSTFGNTTEQSQSAFGNNTSTPRMLQLNDF